ncbi:PBP1A family penicillin-binding protein [Bacillus songklensis]|uniref:PBP1A family penicillin-binding protein n=1 Tax=Bacillus songklensis TaxID=1069116 RepID=A0ABV8B1R5_9BACI
MPENYTSREERRRQQQPQNKRRERQPKEKKRKGGLFRKIIVAVLLLGIVGMVTGGATFFAFVSDAPKIDESLLKDPVSSKVYDKNGDLIAELGAEKRTLVTYEEIPQVVKDAFIATEDVRFYKHHGIDLYRIGGAVVANFKEGFGSEGASTITQQVVKNSFLTPDKTVKRKVQEMWLAFQLEQKYSKQKILEMYLNKIFFAQQAHGVAKAAEYFYGKKVNELELHEAAMLAGMPKAPSTYNPYKNPEEATKRRNTVLNLMAQHGFITQEEADKAKQVPVQSTLRKNVKEDGEKYSAFVDEVIEEVKKKTDMDVFSAGLEIHTTLDPDAQEYVDKLLNSDDIINWPNDEFQTGFVLLDTKTGEVQAVGGGRNRVARGLSFASDFPRQPGSTIKPILDYGPAVEYLKWSTAEPINDEPYTYSNGTPINNYDHRHKGWITARQALAESRNIPALKAFQEAGADRARDFAVGLGIPLEKEIPESYSIGGFENGVTPMQLAGAYSAFGNNGVYNKPHTVTKVKFTDGTEMDLTPKPKVAMKDYTAFMVTSLMESVLEPGGTGRSADIPGLNIAGKTGTTNFSKEAKLKYDIPSGGVPDIWFAGFTPKYTLAVWTGYEQTNSKNFIYSDREKGMAKEIFKKVMAHVSEGKRSGDFERPDSVVTARIEKGSHPLRLASKYTPDELVSTEYFVKGKKPTQVSTRYKKKEISKPRGLSANFDSTTNHIYVNWSYPEDKRNEVSFQVSLSIDGGGSQVIATTNDTSVTIPNPNPGSTYTFTVTALGEGANSSSSTSVTIPGGQTTEPTEDDQGTDQDDQGIDQDDQANHGEDQDEGNETLPPGQQPEPEKDKGKDKEKDTGKENGNKPGEGNEENNGGEITPSPTPDGQQPPQEPQQPPAPDQGQNDQPNPLDNVGANPAPVN